MTVNLTMSGNLTSVQIGFSDTTKGIVGTTTNDSASAGYVGELIDSSGTVSLTSGVSTNVTSISLTAGDWDVNGNVSFATSANVGTQFIGWISVTSASYPGNSVSAALSLSSGQPTSNGEFFNVPYRRYSLASTTTIYLGAQATFSSGTCSVEGRILARRVR